MKLRVLLHLPGNNTHFNMCCKKKLFYLHQHSEMEAKFVVESSRAERFLKNTCDDTKSSSNKWWGGFEVIEDKFRNNESEMADRSRAQWMSRCSQ